MPDYKHGMYLLTCVCGLIDATCFLGLNGVFAEMMTGNLLMVAISLGLGHPVDASFKYVRALIAFSLGVIIGARLLRRLAAQKKERRALWASWALVGLAALLSAWTAPNHINQAGRYVVALLSMAMGVQTAVLRIHGLADLATNLMTMTYAALLAESPLGGTVSERWVRRLLSILLFFVSAIVGAYLVPLGVVWPLTLAFLLMSVATVICHKSAVAS